MTNALASLLLGAAALAAPTAALSAPAPATAPDARLEKMLAGRVAGTPTDCINLRSISSSEVIDGRAIVYRVGSTLYVNEPRSGARQLDRDDVLVTRTHTPRLCSIDTVRLVDRSSRFQRGFVTLGKFVPYTRLTLAG